MCSIIYCCIKITPTLSGLKQQQVIISEFSGSRNPGIKSSTHGLSQGCNQGVGQRCSCLKFRLGQDLLVSPLSSYSQDPLQAVGLRTSIPYCDPWPPSVPCHSNFFKRQLTTWHLASSKWVGRRECQWDRN